MPPVGPQTSLSVTTWSVRPPARGPQELSKNSRLTERFQSKWRKEISPNATQRLDGVGAIESQKSQLWMAEICAMGIVWLSPAGASSISDFEAPNSGHARLPFAEGLPLRAKVVTSAISWSCSAC